jgi:hypothetical protein
MKQIVEPTNASLTINIVLILNYKYVGPQNGPTLQKHAI